MVGKLKERNYNSPSVHGRAEGGGEKQASVGEAPWHLAVRYSDPGLVNRPKLVFDVSDPGCCSVIKICHLVVFIRPAAPLSTVWHHTHCT